MRLLNVPRLTHWRADLRGGLQAAAVGLPMGLAFGVVSGMGPIAGIYSGIITGVCAALFGGTATQISGPTGPIAIVAASIAATFAAQPAALLGIIALAGVMQIGFGALRLGRYISLLPYPVTSGFSTAVGCIIIIMQLNAVIGLPPTTDIVSTLASVSHNIGNGNPATVIVAIAALAACEYMPQRVRTIVPAHLTVLVGGSAIVWLANMDIPTLTAPESLLPAFALPPLLELPWERMWLPALILALISTLDSLLTSVNADNATHSLHDSDRELVGQGIGNVAAGLAGVLPGAGSTFRTLANIRAGGKTPLSALFHSLVLLILVLAIGHLIGQVPAAVLAGILIYIGLGIIDWRYIRRSLIVPRAGVVIMATTCVVSLIVNVITGAAVGIVMASLAFVKRMADLHLAELDIDEATQTAKGLSASEQEALERSGGKAILIRLGGPLTFGAANGLTKRLANVTAYRVLILDFSNVPDIDESGVIAFENIVRRARDHGQAVFVAGLRRSVVRPLLRFGLAGSVRYCSRYRRRIDALRGAAAFVAAENAAAPPAGSGNEDSTE